MTAFSRAGALRPGLPVILPVAEGRVPPEFTAAAAADGFTGAAETLCEVFTPAHVVLAGLGAEPDARALEDAGARAAGRLLRAPEIQLDLRGLKKGDAAALAFGAARRAWRFDRLRTRAEDGAPRLAALHLVATTPGFAESWAKREAVLAGIALARDLVTAPANHLTPVSFVDALAPLVEAGCTLEVIEGAALAPFGGISAVGRAAAHAPRLAVLRWPGTLAVPPVAFVGKGITFDTGGICVKPADGMWEMRADMAGAAACAGALLALARRRSPAPAMAVLALAENALGGDAYRPGDVLRAWNGTTVEVVDTDAEGRLVLMDALAWTAAQAPQAMIDAATLTGSIVVALGHEQAGLFTNDPGLGAALAAAGAAAGEGVWHMPIGRDHRAALESGIADLRHCSPLTRQPDACHAAAFLREFVGETPWAHLDIAGVESRAEGDAAWEAGATGFGVRLLDRLVRDRFEDPHRV